MSLKYIVGGKIVLPEAVVADKALAFDTESGKIVGLVDAVPAGADVIDAKGGYVAPGLVDVHTHGRTKGDFNFADEQGVRDLRKSYAAVGTTTLMATLASATKESLLASMEAISKNRAVEPGTATIAGTHLEGR